MKIMKDYKDIVYKRPLMIDWFNSSTYLMCSDMSHSDVVFAPIYLPCIPKYFPQIEFHTGIDTNVYGMMLITP
jgi:hypothetical protein